MFGNQTAASTGILPLTANILDIVVNNISNAEFDYTEDVNFNINDSKAKYSILGDFAAEKTVTRKVS